jgi:chemotaxis methyl-accepting protein methylase
MNWPDRQERPSMGSAETEQWRSLIHERIGLNFSDSRLYFLEQRLWERMQLRAETSYRRYYHEIAERGEMSPEWLALRDLIVNNESSFFRHAPSFEAFQQQALPELLAAKRREKVNTLMLWSAGCSGGQEAYSLTMSALEHVDPLTWQLRVTGTDISQRQLTKAQSARYKGYEVRYMPAYFKQKYMREEADGVSIRPMVRRLAQFGTLNLHDPANYWVVGQDVIFCQNVLIYFQLEDRIEIVKRLCQRLNIGGYLFLAPAEVVGLQLPQMTLVRWRDVLVYRKSG